MGEKVISRPLSESEVFIAIRHLSGQYNNFQISAKYSQRVDELETLYRCMRKTVLDYHLFICNVFMDGNESSMYYRPISQVLLGDIVEVRPELCDFVNKEDREMFMAECNDIEFPFNVEKPLLRVFLAGKYTIAAAFEHTLVDGMGGRSFHEIVLENFGYVTNPKNAVEFDEKYGHIDGEIHLNSVLFDYEKDKRRLRNSLHPPIDDFIPRSVERANQNAKPVSVSDPHTKWQGSEFSYLGMKYHFKYGNVQNTDLIKMLKRCKENSVSFTSYAEVALAMALNNVVEHGLSVSYKVAINLRRHIKADALKSPYVSTYRDPDRKILGTMANVCSDSLVVSGSPFSWDLVREANENIIKSSNNTAILDVLNPFFGMDKLEFFNRSLNKPKSDGVKISNLGVLPDKVFGESERKWKIVDMVFCQDVLPHSCEFMLNLVSTTEGGLSVVLTYPLDSEMPLHCSNLLQNFIQNLYILADV